LRTKRSSAPDGARTDGRVTSTRRAALSLLSDRACRGPR
jgi:hypothetical protein